MIIDDKIEFSLRTKNGALWNIILMKQIEKERIERERKRWKYNGPGYGKYLKHIQFGFRWNKVEGEKACNLMMINASHY